MMSQPISFYKKYFRNLLILLLVFLPASIGLLALFVSCVPFELVKAHLDTFTVDGDVYFFTPPFFKNIVFKLRLTGIAFIILGYFLRANKTKIKQFLSIFLEDMRFYSRSFASHIKDSIKKEDPLHIFAFLAILLAGIAVRIFFLSVPMRYDEAYTFVEYASKPLYIALSDYSAPNNHMFHTLLVHVSSLIFGIQPWAIRLPALLAGILVIPASYLVMRIFYSKNTALLTTALVASSSILIDYSTNARGYTFVSLFFLLTFALAKYLKDHKSIFGWFLFLFLSALGFYTVPTMLYAWGGVVSWLLLSILFKDTQLSPRYLLSALGITSLVTFILTAFFYLPVFLVSGTHSLMGNDLVVFHSLDFFVHRLPMLHSIGQSWTRDLFIPIEISLIFGFFVALSAHRYLSNCRVPAIAALIVFYAAFLPLHGTIGPPRTWVFLLPMAIGAASAGIVHLLGKIRWPRTWQHASIPFISLLVCMGLNWNIVHSRAVYYSDETGTFRNAEEATLFLKNYLKEGDRVLTKCPVDAPVQFYSLIYGLPKRSLYANGGSDSRFLALVHRKRQTLETVLENAELSSKKMATVKIIQQFPEAILYELIPQ